MIESMRALSPKNAQSSLGFFLSFQILWSLWTGRNEQVFCNVGSRSFEFFALHIETTDNVRAVTFNMSLERKRLRLESTAKLLVDFKHAWPRGYFNCIPCVGY